MVLRAMFLKAENPIQRLGNTLKMNPQNRSQGQPRFDALAELAFPHWHV